MQALIIIAVIAAIAVIAFLLRKFVPGLKAEDTKDAKEESQKHIDNMIVKTDSNIEKEQLEKEKEKERKKQIKQIKKESLTEEEENRRIAELEKMDYMENNSTPESEDDEEN